MVGRQSSVVCGDSSPFLAPLEYGIARELHFRIPEIRRKAGLVFELRHEIDRRLEILPDLRQKRAGVVPILESDAVDARPQLAQRIRLVAETHRLERRKHGYFDRDAGEFLRGKGRKARIAKRGA